MIFAAFALAAVASSAPPMPKYQVVETMVPMRDGVKLQTQLWEPIGVTHRVPIILERTPYGIFPTDKKTYRGLFGSGGYLSWFGNDAYIFVVQNIRGRFKSQGHFVLNRPPCSPKPCVDETTDAYDTVAWLVEHVPNNNGKVGMMGTSYDGLLVVLAALHPHPALKAVSEQASPVDLFLNDDFHHNGAFRLSYGFEYSALLETSSSANTHFAFNKYDTYEWYLDLGPLSNANARYLHGRMPTWNGFIAHPNYDAYWKRQSLIQYLTNPTLPNLNVDGWWDQEDLWGPQEIYTAYRRNDPHGTQYFVAGPWNHGGWDSGPGDALAAVKFGSDTGRYYRTHVLAPWFRYWLYGAPSLGIARATVFETGANRWRSYSRWPVRSTTMKLYLRPHGGLSFDHPSAGDAAFDSYISDPADPVPYRMRPISPTYPTPPWRYWLVQDQRFVDHRPDVLTYETPPLKREITIAGDVAADLFASTTGSDSDWVVKLIDVQAEDKSSVAGYQLMINQEIMRARFRNSFETPEALIPGQITEYKIDLHMNDHVFLRGHRIMVQLQSTWFPLYDRNPQTFVPNIYLAKASDYVTATQRVYHSQDAPSSILLPVVSHHM